MMLKFLLGLVCVSVTSAMQHACNTTDGTCQSCGRSGIGVHCRIARGIDLYDSGPECRANCVQSNVEQTDPDFTGQAQMEEETVFCVPLPPDPPVYCSHIPGDIMPDQIIHCSCGIGFKPNNTQLTCKSDGNYTGNQPTCEPIGQSQDEPEIVSCVPLTPNPNVICSELNGEIKTGQIINCSCEFGFISKTTQLTCESDGSYSGDQPSCDEPPTSESQDEGKIITCIPLTPDPPVFCSHIPGDIMPGLVINCSCGMGFKPNNTKLTCESDGSYSGNQPICQVSAAINQHQDDGETVTCAPVTAVHPVVCFEITGDISPGQVVDCNCDIGYNPNITMLTCENDGSYSGNQPICDAVHACQPDGTCQTCAPIQTEGGGFISGCPARSGIVFYDTGPECFANCATCIPPSPDPNVTCTTTNGDIKPFQSVECSCDAGFIPNTSQMTCNINGTFEGSQPTCNRDTPQSPRRYNLALPPGLLAYSVFRAIRPDVQSRIDRVIDLSFGGVFG